MNGVESQTWDQWLMDVAKIGLQAKWDGEYLERFSVAKQVPPAPAASPTPGQQLTIAGANVSPLMMVAGLVVVGALAWLALRD